MLTLFFTVAVATLTPQHYKFDDDQVLGDVVSADGVVSTSVPKRKRESLMRVRTHFLDELIRSADR
jgi:hypothetical protein